MLFFHRRETGDQCRCDGGGIETRAHPGFDYRQIDASVGKQHEAEGGERIEEGGGIFTMTLFEHRDMGLEPVDGFAEQSLRNGSGADAKAFGPAFQMGRGEGGSLQPGGLGDRLGVKSGRPFALRARNMDAR